MCRPFCVMLSKLPSELLEVVESDFTNILLKQWLQKSVQNAYEKLSKENEIAKTSTEQDVKYKSKDSQRMAAARLRGLLTRKRTRSGSLTVAQPTPLQFTPSRSLRCTSSAWRKQKKSCKEDNSPPLQFFAETW